MNFINKSAPWMVASLLAATSAFGQNKCAPSQKSFEQGHELVQSQMMAAYNAPARIDVRGAWDFYATGSFIYWQPRQENLELGQTTQITTVGSTVTTLNHIINMEFEYKPGFKVGLGMNFDHDNWDAYGEYTWLHGSHNQSSNGPASPSANAYLVANLPNPDVQGDTKYTDVSQKWRLNMDFADVELARSYYVGSKLSFRPFFGARGAWIRQSLDADYTNPTSASIGNNDNLGARYRTHSWGVGPRAGLYTNWMLGQGFRLYGDGFADILYTRYKIRTRDFKVLKSNGTIEETNNHQNKVDYLRTHIDLEMGIGWGSYFDNNNWHIDLLAGYGFQVFFDQNMFRRYVDDVSAGASIAPNGNLYVHGLTTTLRLDF